jgi:hypothetical protein
MSATAPSGPAVLPCAPRVAVRVHGCKECGGKVAGKAEFCCSGCRHAFNNRRRQRGAELYDLYMAHRFERDLAGELGVFQAINRLASQFREEDKAKREGRKSWRNPRAVLEERPYLKAIVRQERFGRGAST